MLLRARQQGFTLIELVVTVVIMGVLAAVSAPLFFNSAGFQERGFFDETVAAVRYAQKYAIASGCTVRVQIVANTSYQLFRAANVVICNTGPYTTALTHPATGAGFSNNAPSGVVLNPATDFTFASDGSTSIAVPVITVGTRTFTVIEATGFVQK